VEVGVRRQARAAGPSSVRVQTREVAEQLLALCTARGWRVIVGIEPDMPEDASDVDRRPNPLEPTRAAQLPGRNDPCHCGSRKKFKKRHGA
jgi:hypothetical protein